MPRPFNPMRGRYRPKLYDFCAIDSEGCNVGKPFSFRPYSERQIRKRLKSENPFEILNALKDDITEITAQKHKTFLWGAGNEKRKTWLIKADKAPLSSDEILHFLLGLKEAFPSSIFVSYVFSYDITQALSDLPYEKLQAIQSNSSSYTFWRGYCIRYLRGKYFTIAKLKPGPVFLSSGKLNSTLPVTIYDVFGFFQCSFVKAISSIPGLLPREIISKISACKDLRTEFDKLDITTIQEYTALELDALCAVMDAIKTKLEEMQLKLTRWNGAGSVASAALTKHRVKEHFQDIRTRDIETPQLWAMHAFFGGRIELLKYGLHQQRAYVYDIVSAYPHAQVSLPSMKGCTWEYIQYRMPELLMEAGGGRKELTSQVSCLSMCEVIWTCKKFPFGPFPYRTPQGAIYYPLDGRGIYCIEEVLAALRAQKLGMPVELYLCGVYRCTPSDNGVEPFDWMRRYYAQRQKLKEEYRETGEYNLMEMLLKLSLNASYGKLAQKVGAHGDNPPVTANPYYAAIITARTRARLLDAAMLDPSAIIMFATDGIASTRPLDVIQSRELGGWDHATIDGGLFVQSGVYWYYQQGETLSSKMRGIKPDNLDTTLHDIVLDAWKNGATNIEYKYKQYITLGMAMKSERWADIMGCWITSQRNLDLFPGVKRHIQRRGRPYYGLVDTLPSDVPGGSHELSTPRIPDWVNLDDGINSRVAEENEEVSAKFEV